MYILTLSYPAQGGATFDFDAFRGSYLPALGRVFGPYGLGYASVLRGEAGLDGKAPSTHATVILSFAEEQAAKDAVASDEGKALLADTAAFTSAVPMMQFNSAVE